MRQSDCHMRARSFILFGMKRTIAHALRPCISTGLPFLVLNFIECQNHLLMVQYGVVVLGG
jgi:hypothetical protein